MNEMAEALELIENDPEWLRHRLKLAVAERDEWQEAYEEMARENMELYAALKRLTSGEFGFKARDVAREALRNITCKTL